jgi:hypothetical protein
MLIADWFEINSKTGDNFYETVLAIFEKNEEGTTTDISNSCV